LIAVYAKEAIPALESASPAPALSLGAALPMTEAMLRLRTARIVRAEDGFGMIELLAAMTVMLIGILAVFGLFQASIIQLRRASTETTAAALADAEMERYRAIRYDSIGLDNSDVAAADATYTGDSAYKAETSPATTLTGSGITSATQLTVPVLSAAGFPSTAPYIVKIDSELILVSGGAGTTTWTVTNTTGRGYLGTTAATHATGQGVTQVKRVNVVKCGTSPCTNSLPTKTVTGADGHSYRVDTYITWQVVTSVSSGSCNPPSCFSGRPAKLITVVVRDNAAPYREWARLSSSFDESTGI
jgi:Tfp pilus assembly protein PilV